MTGFALRLVAVVLAVALAALPGAAVTSAGPDDAAVLTDQQVDAALAGLDGWQHVDGTLRRSVQFPTFLDGIDAVRRVGEHADAKDHHPDMDIRWRTVTFTLITHSAGGITEQDVAMARDINTILGR